MYGGGKGSGAVITSPRDQTYYEIIALKYKYQYIIIIDNYQ